MRKGVRLGERQVGSGYGQPDPELNSLYVRVRVEVGVRVFGLRCQPDSELNSLYVRVRVAVGVRVFGLRRAVGRG